MDGEGEVWGKRVRIQTSFQAPPVGRDNARLQNSHHESLGGGWGRPKWRAAFSSGTKGKREGINGMKLLAHREAGKEETSAPLVLFCRNKSRWTRGSVTPEDVIQTVGSGGT